ncbi:MAG: hypothetical protein DA405_02015 [Bacteroidetes bacterium]|nr:MAG: hypothetical protein DA405_02015 [Bacteroidota bacterium]
MKTTLYSLALALLSLGLQAQKKLLPKHEKFVFYDLSYLAFADAPAGTENAIWSVAADVGFMFESSWSERGGIGYGLSYSFQGYGNNHLVSTDLRTGEGLYELGTDTTFKSASQNLQYLYIPVELRFRSKKNEAGKFYRFYLGARAGVRTLDNSVIRRENSRVRYYQLDNLARFRADAYLKVGYGNMSLFGFYSLTPLYTGGEILTAGGTRSAPLKDLRPFGIGFSFMF